MLVEELIKKVRITMDENSSSSRLAEIKDIDSLQLDELIRESIVAGVKYIHSNADVTELTDDVTEDAKLSHVEEKMIGSEKYIQYIDCPSDFHVLSSIKMSRWKKPVRILSVLNNVNEDMELCPYYGIGSDQESPAVYLTERNGKRVFMACSCEEEGSSVETFRYLPLPSIKEGNIKIIKGREDDCAYAIAYNVFMSLGDTSMASAMAEKIKMSAQ